MLCPSQIHFHPHKPAIYVDYAVNSVRAGVQKQRRRLIPIRGLRRSKAETHNAAALAERLLLRHTDLLAHVGRERLRVIVQHVIGIVTGEIAAEFGERVKSADDCDRKIAESDSMVKGRSVSVTEAMHTRQGSKLENTQHSNTRPMKFVMDGNEDLNKLGDAELRQIKQELDKEFDKIRIKQDDPHFIYDRRVEFPKNGDKEENDWDADDEEPQVGYIPSLPQSANLQQAQPIKGFNTLKPVAPSPTITQPVSATSVVSPALTIPESPSMKNPSPQASPHSASISIIPLKTPARELEILTQSPIASSPAASVVSELLCDEIPSQLSSAAASPVYAPIKSPPAVPVAESPSLLIPTSPAPPSATTPSSLALARPSAPGGIITLPTDPVPEDAYEDDFSDFGAGETASHASSKSSSTNHSRSSTHQSTAEIKAGATDSEPESDADDDEAGSDRRASVSRIAASPNSAIPALHTATKPLLASKNIETLKPVRPLVSMHEASDIDEDIDEEIEVFEDETQAADD